MTKFILLLALTATLSSYAKVSEFLYFCIMMQKKYVTLSEEEQKQLQDLVRNSPNHRIRQRSQALLWSHFGKDRATIAALYGVRKDTVSAWLNNWASTKVKSLPDLPRTGRPSKLSREEKKVWSSIASQA
jgi:hypothetical protein